LGGLGGVSVLIRAGRRSLGPALVLWIAGLASGGGAAAETIVLIAHADLELEGLTVPVLRQLYLGRRTRFDGKRLHWFQLPPGTADRRAFARLALERSERDLERYWLEQALSGGSLPPREFPSAEELVEHISARERAIGYLTWERFQGLQRAGVRVVPLWVDGEARFPGDAAYPLRDPGLHDPASTP